MKGQSIISPNAKPTPAREPREFKPLTLSPAMRVAYERAREAQPGVRALATNVVAPYVDWTGRG